MLERRPAGPETWRRGAGRLHPHRRNVVRVKELLRVVTELEHAALAAEVVRLPVVLGFQLRASLGIDVHAADGVLLDRHRGASSVDAGGTPGEYIARRDRTRQTGSA